MQNAIAFSTLSCPEWDIDRILQAAIEYGYDAVELRGYLATRDLTVAEPFTNANREATRQRFAENGIAFCCVSSSGIVAQGNLDHVTAHCELAHDLHAPFVRVFGGNLPDGLSRETAMEAFAETLRQFGEAAAGFGVQIVLETHDAFSTGAAVAELLTATNHPAVFALWDLHQPYRQGEEPSLTMYYLAPFLRYVHIKDGRDGTYTLPGDGDLPLNTMRQILHNAHYSGVISVEWEKRWHPSLAPPEVALPAYSRFLRS